MAVHRVGSLSGQPCYPCAALVWSQLITIVRICSPIRPNAGCLAVYVQKAGVVAAFGCLNLFFGLLVRGDLAGARGPEEPWGTRRHGRRLHRNAPHLMIFRIGSESTRAVIGHARASKTRGQPPEWRTGFFEAVRRPLPALSAKPSVQPCLWLPWRQAPRSSCAGLRLGGKPRRRH